MNEESDLRIYIDVLRKHWRTILAATVICGVVALAVSLASPVRFQATATVLVTSPLSEFRLSVEGQDTSGSLPPLAGKAALGLATNDALLEQVLAEVAQELPEDQRNLTSLRRMLAAKAGNDPSVINLSATVQGAERAALVANTWADLYVRQVNEFYGKSPDQSRFYAEQLTQAQSELKSADQALVDFQNGSELTVLQAQLSAKQKALADYLAMDESLVLLQQDATNLQERLAHRPADSPSTLSDELAQLLLQVSVLSARSAQLPIQLQLPTTGAVSDKSSAQQAAYVAELVKTIESRRAETQKQANTLLPEIKGLQGRIEEISTEATKLTRARDLAQNVHAALALKAREASITARAESGGVRLVSSAAAPDQPMSKKVLTKTALALLVGLMAVVAVVFIFEYFRTIANVSSGPRPEHVTTEEALDHPAQLKEAQG